MARYHEELLAAGRLMLSRRAGQRGRLPSARIRRSISISYYALFHFLAEDCGFQIIGTGGHLLSRRRIYARTFTHRGLKLALVKVKDRFIAEDVREFFRAVGAPGDPVESLPFARTMARVFIQAQDQRHTADYDLTENLPAVDAELLANNVVAAIGDWTAAISPVERRFKQDLCILMSLRGKLRSDDT